MNLRHRQRRFARIALPSFVFLLECASLVEALIWSERGRDSYSLIRKPRLVLRPARRDAGALLDFFNAEALGVQGALEDTINCTVSGGHLREEADGELRRVTAVSIKRSPTPEKWRLPEELSVSARSTAPLQTMTRFNVSYDVEGELKCACSLGLVSNTLLLRYGDRESMVVGLRGRPGVIASETYEVLRRAHVLYAAATGSTQEGRLVELRLHPDPEAVLRVSYLTRSGASNQRDVHAAVEEATRSIADDHGLRVAYVRSTRYCLPEEEGNFTWPLTSAGSTAVPSNPCVGGNGSRPQPTRACLGNFFEGAHWEELPQRPRVCEGIAERDFFEIIRIAKKVTRRGMLELMYEEIVDGKPLSVVEVYYAAEIFRKAAENVGKSSWDISGSANISTVVKIMDTILKCNKSIIRAADDLYGSSQIILESALLLLAGVASPNPVPITSQKFSVFSSKAGAGTQGFAYYNSEEPNKTPGRMVIFDHKHSFTKVLARKEQPKVLAYLKKQFENCSLISTLFEEDSLFSAAKYPGMKLEGPILGLKVLQKGGEGADEMTPIPIFVNFMHSSNKEFGVQCVSWEPTRIGGWSKSGCNLHFSSENKSICLCVILKSVDMFFTIVRDGLMVEFNRQHLQLQLMKSNNGALLVIYRAELNASLFLQDTNKALSCSLTGRRSEDEKMTHLTVGSDKTSEMTNIGNVSYSGDMQMVFYSIPPILEGYLQCNDNLGLGLISNQIFLSKPNSASVRFRSGGCFYSEKGCMCELLEKMNTSVLFRTTCDMNDDVIIRVTAISETNHSHFIHLVESHFENFALINHLPFPVVRSDHFCLQRDEGGFMWPTTRRNHLAAPVNPCINNTNHGGAPSPVRKCIGDYYEGAYWDESPQKPDLCEQPLERALRMKNISSNVVKSDISGEDILVEVLASLRNESQINVTKVDPFQTAFNSLAEVVSRTDSEVSSPTITSIANFVNALIEVERKVDVKTNGTQTTVPFDALLSSIDKMIEKSATPTPIPVVTPNFLAVAVSPGAGIKGFVTDEKDASPVDVDKTIADVMALAPKAGAFLVDAPEKVGITYTNFKDSTLFRGTNGAEDSRVITSIIGFNVFGHEENESPLNTTAIIIFLHESDSIQGRRGCHYWDTTMREWSQDGITRVSPCDLPSTVPSNMDICLSVHLTHFAMLIVDNEDFLSEDYILHLLTIVGCFISLISLSSIFFIGISCPQWYRATSKKIQINLSASIALTMAAYLAIALQGDCPQSRGTCVALGVLLHYSILAAFSWMLIAAFLQLRRLTRKMVLSARANMGTHLILRASFFGWGVPVLPVAAILVAGTDLYALQPNSALCYPSGMAHKAGVLFPIALVITINTFIFFRLVHSLFCSKVEGVRVNQRNQRQHALRRFYATVFLFCLLGIFWLPGMFINLSNKSKIAQRALSYVICIMATLQGTFLFIFFVACESRYTERLSRAALTFSQKWIKNHKEVNYKAKKNSNASERAADPNTLFHC